jgi:hypothetical protein
MGLSEENRRFIIQTIKEAGDHLQGKLPPCKFLKKRNPYAHLYERLKSRLGKSYKDCDDKQVPEILRLIEWYRNNPC